MVLFFLATAPSQLQAATDPHPESFSLDDD